MDFEAFIIEHAGDDTGRLLLSGDRYPGIDVRKAVATIEARRKIRTKVPAWFQVPSLEYPTGLSIEQCSSQATASYKQRFVPEGGIVADITGGLGVDSYFMSLKAGQIVYHERQKPLADAAALNFNKLKANNIIVTNASEIDSSRKYDLIYADPARRSNTSARIYAIEDCEPDIIKIKDRLLDLSDRLLVKVSPMVDISRAEQLFPEASEFHVVSVGNEVKELLIYIDRTRPETSIPKLYAVDIPASGGIPSTFVSDREQEKEAGAEYADSIGAYIYQPSRALLKIGAFKCLCGIFDIRKLSVSTHLYTSDRIVEDFPGKRFAVRECFAWNKAGIKKLQNEYEALDMTAVNFPLDTISLRKRIGIKEGGPYHLFVTTLASEKICIVAVLVPATAGKNGYVID